MLFILLEYAEHDLPAAFSDDDERRSQWRRHRAVIGALSNEELETDLINSKGTAEELLTKPTAGSIIVEAAKAELFCRVDVPTAMILRDSKLEARFRAEKKDLATGHECRQRNRGEPRRGKGGRGRAPQAAPRRRRLTGHDGDRRPLYQGGARHEQRQHRPGAGGKPVCAVWRQLRGAAGAARVPGQWRSGCGRAFACAAVA